MRSALIYVLYHEQTRFELDGYESSFDEAQAKIEILFDRSTYEVFLGDYLFVNRPIQGHA